MEKSNDLSLQNESILLERTVRRFQVSKDFFAAIACAYFMTTLFAVGGIATTTMSIVSKGLYPILFVSSGVLLFSGYTSWSITQ
jgi:hypothetical protein